MKVDELHMYDLFAPLVDEFKMDITFDEAKATIIESLKPLGQDYLNVLQQGFTMVGSICMRMKANAAVPTAGEHSALIPMCC